MAHQRTSSVSTAEGLKEPHALSLKVLRLTRPSLATQYPLPHPSPSSTLAQSIPRSASLAYPSAPSDPFALSPLLTLPPAFGNAYVGETFSCTLCANNELMADTPRIHGVKIEAEMKTPSLTTPLPVSFGPSSPSSSFPPDDDTLQSKSPNPPSSDLAHGTSLHGIISYHLREDGPHVLAVTVSYTSTSSTSGRLRSFRKLYQFVARPALVVRTKIAAVGSDKRKGWALEAQLENVGEDGMVLEDVDMNTEDWCKARSLEECWDEDERHEEKRGKKKHILGRGGVHQACFFVERVKEVEQEGKPYMGVLNIKWRGPMGNPGELATGWLGLKAR